MLKKQVTQLRKLSIEYQSKNEDLEQYCRCLCLCIDGILAVSNESSDEEINLAKSLFKEVKASVPENVLDCAHRIRPIYTGRVSKKKL